MHPYETILYKFRKIWSSFFNQHNQKGKNPRIGKTIEMKYSRCRVSLTELFKTLIAPRVLNVTSSYLLSDFSRANLSRSIITRALCVD